MSEDTGNQEQKQHGISITDVPKIPAVAQREVLEGRSNKRGGSDMGVDREAERSRREGSRSGSPSTSNRYESVVD